MRYKVALFVPCFIDNFYPNVALATYRLLKKLGFDVYYPSQQTCCGQPMLNSGFSHEAKLLAERFVNIFNSYDYIVAPSGSCIATVRYKYKDLLSEDVYKKLSKKSFEICEFLTDVAHVKDLDVSFEHKVGFHQSCHGLRELALSSSSEQNIPFYSKPRRLLEMVKGLEIVPLQRVDECCGFGGTFSINQPDISVKMGEDRISDHKDAGAQYIAGYDSSCLMHMEGIAKRQNIDIRFVHIVEILAGMVDETR